jgi:transcriptional regulator with XRE-family HTH domain
VDVLQSAQGRWRATPALAGCLVKGKHPTFRGVPDILELAQRLRWLRQCLGLTQEEFAEHAGLSYKFYQQIESGRKKQVWLETLERIAIGFGLESWQLLAPTPPPTLRLGDYPETVALASRWIVADKPAVSSSRPTRGLPGKRPRKKPRGR